jgi:hypothetical protein
MTRRRWRIALAFGLLLLLVGASLSGHRPARLSHRRTGTGKHLEPALRPTGYRRPRVIPGRAGSAHAALYHFAAVYGQLSPGSAQTRQSELIALAAPPLRTSLVRAAPQALAAVSRGLGPGESMQATVASVSIGAEIGQTQHAAVVLEQHQVSAAGRASPPVEISFFVVLTHGDGRWLVSRFIPVM